MAIAGVGDVVEAEGRVKQYLQVGPGAAGSRRGEEGQRGSGIRTLGRERNGGGERH